MENSKQLLTSVLQTAQMGQTGIRCVRGRAVEQGLCAELDAELSQYDAIEKQALQLARERGWELPQIHPVLRQMSQWVSRARLIGGDTDSKIAAMMIQGNTRAMILGVRDLRRCAHGDSAVTELAQQLLDGETVNIRKNRAFL